MVARMRDCGSLTPGVDLIGLCTGKRISSTTEVPDHHPPWLTTANRFSLAGATSAWANRPCQRCQPRRSISCACFALDRSPYKYAPWDYTKQQAID